MTHKSIAIIGGGGHACVVAEAASLSGWGIIGHIAHEPAPVDLLGDYLGFDDVVSDLSAKGTQFAVGIGFADARGAATRARIIGMVPEEALTTIVHPNAVVSPNATLYSGAFVAAGAAVNAFAELGSAAIVNTGAIVEHHCCIGKNSHIATGARLTGDVSIGANALIGAGATIRQGLSVGNNSILGSGSVLLKNMPDHTVWTGNPARHLDREVQE